MEVVKIVIIEDNAVTLDLIKVILTHEGYSVSGFVASGQEAVELALNARADLLLMAVRLRGEFDGITAYLNLKKVSAIPVVFISTHGDKETIDRAMRTTARGFITKPFTISELTETVRKALAAPPGMADI